jgi:hypothetical protein
MFNIGLRGWTHFSLHDVYSIKIYDETGSLPNASWKIFANVSEVVEHDFGLASSP